MRLGILGGTFDPIHFAHLFIAEEARARHALDRVVFVVSALPPHKARGDMALAAHRFAMARLATAANPAFECSRMELDRPGPSYTFDTLTALRAAPPEAELFFITGSDTIPEIPTWHRSEELVRLTHFISAERPGYSADYAEQGLPAELVSRVLPLPTIHLDISSTGLRRRIHAGLPIRYLTPDTVVEYIAAHGLYR